MEHQFNNYFMEARALKSKTLVEQQQEQGLYQEMFCFDTTTSTTNALISSSTEDFSVVDCFFDFSNTTSNNNNGQHVVVHQKDKEEQEEEEKDDSLSDLSSQERFDDDFHSNSTSSDLIDSVFVSGLAVPQDDIAELEWVSHFVDDSLPEFPVLCPLNKPEKKTESRASNWLEPEPKLALTRPSCIFPSRVPGKSRTKRPRPTCRTWSVAELQVESPSISSASFASSSSSNSGLVFTSIVELPNSGESPMKKKKRLSGKPGESTGFAQFQRRCSHCQVQKTPQWRTGPLGAKTLCNACGVRYKSGRLFPEYRPACSPTFSGGIHSNSHRKVLEMRKKKESTQSASNFNQMVQSF